MRAHERNGFQERRFERPGASAPRGYTLIEVTFVAALICLIVGTIGAVFPALTSASVETGMFMLAQSENDRIRILLTEDLQTTDAMGLDQNGVPYFQIVDHGGGTANSVVFRKAIDYTINPGEDLVQTVYSTPIQYWVDGSGNLVRTQDGVDRVVAQRVAWLQFAKSAQGIISVTICTRYARGTEQLELQSEVQIVSRNSQRA